MTVYQNVMPVCTLQRIPIETKMKLEKVAITNALQLEGRRMSRQSFCAVLANFVRACVGLQRELRDLTHFFLFLAQISGGYK